MDLFTGGSVIVEYFGRKQGLKLKQYNDGFLTKMQLFTSQDVN